MKGVSISTIPGKFNVQFVVHVKNEYDYFYESEHRLEILEALKHAYHYKFKTNIPIYGVPDDLSDFHTTKKDISQGIEVIPKESYRLHSEDKYVTAFDHDKTKNGDLNFSKLDWLNDNDDYPDNEDQMIIESANKELALSVHKSMSMFYREESEKDAKLDDFKIIKVIGKGGFGKVFLV